MPQPVTRIRIHAIINTKDKLPLLNAGIERAIYDFFKDELANHGCQVDMINGSAEHVHIIFILNPGLSLTQIVDELLSSSTIFINKNYFPSASFSWQADYLAFGVSESQLPKMIEFVTKQKEIHKKQTYLQEYNEFLRLHGLDK
jgi:putative transposase